MDVSLQDIVCFHDHSYVLSSFISLKKTRSTLLLHMDFQIHALHPVPYVYHSRSSSLYSQRKACFFMNFLKRTLQMLLDISVFFFSQHLLQDLVSSQNVSSLSAILYLPQNCLRVSFDPSSVPLQIHIPMTRPPHLLILTLLVCPFLVPF